MTAASTILPLTALPKTLPLDGAVRIELQNGIPIFRASQQVQERIETLLDKRDERSLTEPEEQELDSYAEMDDYLSFVNRMVRNNLMQEQPPTIQHGA
jgi:uncharacterized protein YnzC (UPF0291/DUF896 family)